MQTTRTGSIPPYIGADLTDRYASGARPIDVCGLQVVAPGRFEAQYWQWNWDRAPAALDVAPIADEVTGAVCTLIDGPQALAREGEAVRECERLARTPGRTPDQDPDDDRFMSGFIRSSLDLFRALHRAGVAISPPGFLRGVGEIYPGALWPIVVQRVLPKKGTTGGQVSRRAVLQALGVQHLPSLTSHDQADACLAAVFAAAADGQVPGLTVGALGHALEIDGAGILREGPIAMPAKIESRLQEKIDRSIAQPAAQGVLGPEGLARSTVTIDLAKVRVEAPSMKPKGPKVVERSPAPRTPVSPSQPAAAPPEPEPLAQPKITRRPSTGALSKPAAPPFAPKKPLENRPGPKAKPKAATAPTPAPDPQPTPPPKKRAAKKKAAPSKKRAASPKQKPAPPKKRAASPKKKTAPPKKRAASPKQKTAPPKKRAASPKQKTAPPKKRAASQKKKATPPRKKPTATKRVAPGSPPPKRGSRAARAQALADWMVKELRAGRPVVATYAWIHRFCLGRYPSWSGARTKAVRELAGATKARAAGAIGTVRLDCFVVARATRRPGPGYKRGVWKKALGNARLLA